MKRKIQKISIPSGRYSFRRLRNTNEGKNCRVSGTAVISKPIVIVSTTGSTVIDNQVHESNLQASHETQIEEANVLLTRTTQGITTHTRMDQNNEIINLDNGRYGIDCVDDNQPEGNRTELEHDNGDLDVGEIDVGELDAGEPDVGERGVGEPGVGEHGVCEPGAGEPSVGELGDGEPASGQTELRTGVIQNQNPFFVRMISRSRYSPDPYAAYWNPPAFGDYNNDDTGPDDMDGTTDNSKTEKTPAQSPAVVPRSITPEETPRRFKAVKETDQEDELTDYILSLALNDHPGDIVNTEDLFGESKLLRVIDESLGKGYDSEHISEYLAPSKQSPSLTFQDLANMMLMKHLPELILNYSSIGRTDWQINSDRVMSLLQFGGGTIHNKLAKSASYIGGDHDNLLIYLRVLSRSASISEACLTLITMLRHWPAGMARNYMVTWSTNYLYHCSKDLNLQLLPNGMLQIPPSRFILINGTTFKITNPHYQFVDKFGGCFGLARAEPTHHCDDQIARPCLLVLNRLFAKEVPHIDANNKMKLTIERSGQFMVGRPDVTTLEKSLQVLKHVGPIICSGIRKAGRYTCRILLLELDALHSGLILCPDYVLRKNHQSDRSYNDDEFTPELARTSFRCLKTITSNQPDLTYPEERIKVPPAFIFRLREEGESTDAE